MIYDIDGYLSSKLGRVKLFLVNDFNFRDINVGCYDKAVFDVLVTIALLLDSAQTVAIPIRQRSILAAAFI